MPLPLGSFVAILRTDLIEISRGARRGKRESECGSAPL